MKKYLFLICTFLIFPRSNIIIAVRKKKKKFITSILLQGKGKVDEKKNQAGI
jgi:hypothetical protein